jgi:tetrahydromethanopterin S-methyltransferase subunit G
MLNRRVDELRSDMNDRFGEVNRRLDRIEDTLKFHSTKITSLEERVSPLGRR